MRLLQIEEPDGSPADRELPGAAIGVDASGACAEAAFAVGGNAALLQDRAEFLRVLPVPPSEAAAAWQALFERVRLRAERVLGRPVTHAVVVVAAAPADGGALLRAAAAAAGIEIMALPSAAALSGGEPPALAAALLAEDLLPRTGTGGPGPAFSR